MDQNDPIDASKTVAVSPSGVGGLYIDLGRQDRDALALLRGGSGQVTEQINAAIERWRETLGIDVSSDIVPVVLLYTRHDDDLG
jgi:hypothetical protein